jgi:hypothetical protein
MTQFPTSNRPVRGSLANVCLPLEGKDLQHRLRKALLPYRKFPEVREEITSIEQSSPERLDATYPCLEKPCNFLSM